MFGVFFPPNFVCEELQERGQAGSPTGRGHGRTRDTWPAVSGAGCRLIPAWV